MVRMGSRNLKNMGSQITILHFVDGVYVIKTGVILKKIKEKSIQL